MHLGRLRVGVVGRKEIGRGRGGRGNAMGRLFWPRERKKDKRGSGEKGHEHLDKNAFRTRKQRSLVSGREGEMMGSRGREVEG